MAILRPKLAILDETDSGLDIDALKIVADGVECTARAGISPPLVITHYQRLLEHIVARQGACARGWPASSVPVAPNCVGTGKQKANAGMVAEAA